jgi:tRNA(His) guanylyltransferase
MDDALGDRMKSYEMMEAGRRTMPQLPVIARLDGKNFSSFTRGLARPYDERLSRLMVDATLHLCRETNANCGYTQSDEITLAWYSADPKSQIYFDGRIQKMCSVLAASASVYFGIMLPMFLPEKSGLLPVFDCRVWTVPTLEEGANTFLWREFDATKNSISMAARCHYSHKQLEDKNGKEMQEMLFQKGVNWNDFPGFFKRGTYVVRKKFTRKFTADELDILPPLHDARKDPNLMVERTEFARVDMPRLASISNRVGVIFLGEDPILEQRGAGDGRSVTECSSALPSPTQ